MNDRHRSATDPEVLPTDVAERLLARTAELDLAQRSGAEIARLREASTEAGMLPSAFDAALAELRDEGRRRQPRVSLLGSRGVRRVLAVAIVSVVAVVATKRAVSSPVAGVEQVFSVRCMPASIAATALVRSLPNPASTELTIPPNDAAHTLTIHTATRKQMEEVREAIEQMEGVACRGLPASQRNR